MAVPFDSDDVAAAAAVSNGSGISVESYTFEGHVDFYGYHMPAGGWFFGGWLSYPWPPGHRPRNVRAEFADLSIDQHAHSIFYHRNDVRGRGIGFVFYCACAAVAAGDLLCIRIECADRPYTLHPTPDVLSLRHPELLEHLQAMLAGGEEGSERRRMQQLLLGEQPPEVASGFIDFYGYHAVAGGWMFCGWVTRGWPEARPPEQITVCFEDGDVVGEAFAILYPRQDLQNGGQGCAFFVRGAATPLGNLWSVSFEAGSMRATMQGTAATARLREAELLTRFRPLLGQTMAGPHRDILAGLLARRPYVGEDTLSALGIPVFVEIDEAIRCGADGLLLMGWCLARPDDIREIRVRSGPLIASLVLEDCIRIERPDVVEGFATHGFSDPRCGFIAFLPCAIAAEGRLYIEVETYRRDVGYRNVPPLKLGGIAAIKRLLAAVDVRFAEVRRAFDHVLGPAVEALNRTRLATSPAVTVIDYGNVPEAPRFSVIVPLYGRLDFVEYQLALFSAHPACAEVEFLYVLDDPPRRREAQFLFASVHERFLVPFRAVLLEHNVGFAPANNIGLAHARGEFVSYLNSDVFPGTLDWLERLADRLTSDPTIGVIGPLLLFEDGSVQHRGMVFSRLPEFGDWFFGQHLDKGLRHAGNGEVEPHISITGACMLLRRALAEQLGGFDEVYVIGDFEDSDLCLRIQALGYRCVVDPDVQLFHLERKSQASSGLGWRMNLTVYNAWQHERRWGSAIAARQGG